MAQTIQLLGAVYSDVPAVELPKSGGGTAAFTDVTDTTALASDVAAGKYFYTAAGVRTVGTATGGGAVAVVETQDTGGGTALDIVAVDISNDTVDAAHLTQGYTAHDATGQAIVGTMSGGSTPEVTVTTGGAVTQEIQPDTFYHFTSTALTALTLTFGGGSGEQYHFDFISPSTAVTLTLPASVSMETGFSVEANTRYELDIYGGYGVFAEWSQS